MNMKFFNILLIFSVGMADTSSATSSSFVDIFNLLQRDFLTLKGDEARDSEEEQQRIEENKKIKREEQMHKAADQASKAKWIRTPEGLKLYIQAGDKEISESFGLVNDDSASSDDDASISLEIKGNDSENCEQNCDMRGLNEGFLAEGLRANSDRKGAKCQKADGDYRRGTYPRDRAAAYPERTKQSLRYPQKHERFADTRRHRHEAYRFEGHGARKEGCRDREEFHRFKRKMEMEEAIFVEMRRQIKILKHIEEMLERQEESFRKLNGNNEGRN